MRVLVVSLVVAAGCGGGGSSRRDAGADGGPGGDGAVVAESGLAPDADGAVDGAFEARLDGAADVPVDGAGDPAVDAAVDRAPDAPSDAQPGGGDDRGLDAPGDGTVDDAAKLVGSWTFTSGDLMFTNCPGSIPPFAVSMTGFPVEITETDPQHVQIRVQSAACDLTFAVNASFATAFTGQVCMLTLPLDGSSTQQTILVSSWILAVNGATLDSSLTGAGVCANVTGTGTMARTARDAGATD